MRLTFVFGLTLFISAPAVAVGADRPIPQDAARMQKRFRERLEWNRRTLQEAYDRIGKKDPRWDKPAREALDLAARMFAQQFDPIVLNTAVHVPARKAVEAGCDDPLILYLHARLAVGRFFTNWDDSTRRIQEAADGMAARGYSPYRRAVALRIAIERKAWDKDLGPADRRMVEQKLDAILELLPKSVAEDPRNEDWERAWYNEINAIIAAHRQLGGDYQGAYDRVDAKLAKIKGIEALRLTIKGNFQLQWGWEARTQKLAAAVREDQFRKFATRVTEAVPR